MSRHDRCVICDYSEAEGGAIPDIAPGRLEVRYNDKLGDTYCTKCAGGIWETIHDYPKEELNDDGLGEGDTEGDTEPLALPEND